MKNLLKAKFEPKNVRKRKLKFVYDEKTAMLHCNNEKCEKKEMEKHLCCASSLIVSKEVLANTFSTD